MYETHQLPNGIRIIHESDLSDVVYLGMVIKTGTRDEMDSESGMAHLVEHMLFKGTTHRKSWHIVNRLDGVGGEINAYTTKEETFIYATVLRDDYERAFELIADIVFHSTFPQNELEKELEIVQDEINLYRDSPSELIYDDFEEMLFCGQPIGRNILGDSNRLEEYTSADLCRFVQNNYRSSEMVFFSLGNIPFKKVVRLSEKYFTSSFPIGEKKRIVTSSSYLPQQKAVEKDTHQCHYMLGTRSFSLYDERERMVLYLLNNIVGGPSMNSLLNLAIRERNGLAYNVESSSVSYTDTGVWNVYFGCDKKNQRKCEHILLAELEKLCTTRISEAQLLRYKKQFLAQQVIASSNRENLAIAMGKSFLYYGRFDSQEDVRQQTMSVQPDEIQNVARQIFNPNNFTTLIFV